MFNQYIIPLFCLLLWSAVAVGQDPAKTTTPSPAAQPHSAGPAVKPANVDGDSLTVTIILKHQQDKNLPEIRRILEAQGFWDMFPPSDARIVSWTLAMGLGHVIVMKLPAAGLRRLNLGIENGGWGAFDSEFYISYDYKPIWQDYLEKREDAKAERN